MVAAVARMPDGIPVGATINSERVQLHTLVDADGNQVLLRDADGTARGRAFWLADPSVDGGRRCVFQRVERDVIRGGDKVDEATKRPVMVYEDVYIRPKSLHMFHVPRTVDNEHQTVSVMSSRGNSKHRDLYLEKGMRFATPEEFIESIARAARNGVDGAKRKLLRDPIKQSENLVAMLREALAPLSGTLADGRAAAATEERKALEAMESHTKKK